jgi:hypothetical protein
MMMGCVAMVGALAVGASGGARLKIPNSRVDLLGRRKRIEEIDADLTLLHRTASGRE